MPLELPLPTYKDNLADFLGDLRQAVFSSQVKAARYFGLHSATISRYEQGQILPPVGYAAELMVCALQRLNVDDASSADRIDHMLTQAQEVIGWCFEGTEIPATWQGVVDLADGHMGRRRSRVSWEEAPDPEELFGRREEADYLGQALGNRVVQVVGIWGMGGIGKSALAAAVAREYARDFDFTIWRTLRNAPPLIQLLGALKLFISEQAITPDTTTERGLMLSLLELFKTHRCLLILDNFESILEQQSPSGEFRRGFEGYADLIALLADTEHSSCVLLTGREKPSVFVKRERRGDRVRSLALSGLSAENSADLQTKLALNGSRQDWQELVANFSGNPLALQLVADVIHTQFGKTIRDFLDTGVVAFGDISLLLEEHIVRLSPLEGLLLHWLAIEREARTVAELINKTVISLAHSTVLSILNSLTRRSLVIVVSAGGYTLQNVVMEHLTERLIEHLFEEIRTGQLDALRTYGIAHAGLADYVRDQQRRVLLDPIQDRLEQIWSPSTVQQRLLQLLEKFRRQDWPDAGYGPSNILHLLIHLETVLDGLDLSHLALRYAYLVNTSLRQADLTGADLLSAQFAASLSTVMDVSFSPDGARLALALHDKRVQVWATHNTSHQMTYEGHTETVRCVRFDPSGRLLASSSDDFTIRLWHAESGRLLNSLTGHTDRVRQFRFIPDSQRIVSVSDDMSVRVWDIVTGACVAELRGHTGRVWSVAVSTDGTLCATSGIDSTIVIWNLIDHKSSTTIECVDFTIWALAFHPEGRWLATGADDGNIYVYDLLSKQQVQPRVLRGHTSFVRSLTFATSGHHLISASDDRTVKVWDAGSWQCKITLLGHTSPLRAVTIHPLLSNIIASGGVDGSIRLWDIERGQMLSSIQGLGSTVLALSLHPNGKVVASCGSERLIKIWNYTEQRPTLRVLAHNDSVVDVAFDRSGALCVSGSQDGTVKIWDTKTWEVLNEMTHGHPAISVDISPDGKSVAVALASSKVYVWPLFGTQPSLMMAGVGWFRGVRYSADGKLLLGASEDNQIWIWQTGSGARLRTLSGHTSWVWTLAVCQFSSLIVSGSDDGTLRLWDGESGECLRVIEAHSNLVRSVAISPDGTRIASASADQTINVWRRDTGACIWSVAHTHRISSVKFNPVDQTLISGSEDGTLRIWDHTGNCLRVLGPDRIYEGMNIRDTRGLARGDVLSLKQLGAEI